MKRIGLTGGIASGKSTVARWIASRGVPLIDADALSRRVVEPGMPALAAIGRRWPEVVAAGDGALDRRALGRLVFADGRARRELDAIMLPAIAAAFERWALDCERAGQALCVYDAALLFEHHLDARFDGVLLIASPPELQLARLMARDALTEAEARQRIAAQLPLAAKRARARWVLENDGALDALRGRFEALWPRIAELALAR